MSVNKTLFYFFLLHVTLFSHLLRAQESKVSDSPTVYSKILKKEMAYAVYLPKGYESSNRRYPVLYLLHGAGGDQNSWIQEGEMQSIVDKAIAEGKATQMIVIMPDAGLSYFINSKDGKYPFADFFINELVPHIDLTYRSRSEKKYRAIAGLSMGGYGALLYGLLYPELFSTSAAMSAAVRTDEEINQMSQSEYLRRYGRVMGEIKEGDTRITEFWNRHSILHLVKQLDEGQKKMVRFYFEIGDDDNRYKGNALLHTTMRDLGISHEYRVKNGSHDWEYWRGSLPEVLTFISDSFRQK